MENTLCPGDRILVNKLSYGSRLPKLDFEIPWLNLLGDENQNTKVELSEVKLSRHRLSGFSHVKQGDVAVFNRPGKIEKFLIKRCVALPGDSLQIINSNLYINNELQLFFGNLKLEYMVYFQGLNKFNQQLDSIKNPDVFELNQLNNNFYNLIYHPARRQNKRISFLVYNMSIKQKAIIENLASVDSICIHTRKSKNSSMIFPQDSTIHWSIDNFGLIVIPKKEMEINLDNKTYALYKSIFQKNENIIKTDTGFYQGNKQVKTYRFKQDYYFMLGDNRHNSFDSRYFGFVPEHYIIGKASRIVFSKEPYGKIRWNRIFKRINN